MSDQEINRIATSGAFEWSCPICRGRLLPVSEFVRCIPCGGIFEQRSGVWDFLPDARAAAYAEFLEHYEVVRHDERWGSADSTYYRSLPCVAPGDSNRAIWRLRAHSFRIFMQRILRPLEAVAPTPLRIIDLGAGNGWLTYRLSQRGHVLAAVDLRCGTRDGLGVHAHYDARFTSVRAEFDRLPFADAQFDVAIFNASLHYSVDYESTLREALRILRPMGTLVVMDSPLYRDDEGGRRMVREREESFRSRYGFASDALPSEHYLTSAILNRIAAAIGIAWTRYQTFSRIRWTVRRLRAFLSHHRPPAEFPVFAAQKPPLPPATGVSNACFRRSPSIRTGVTR